MIKMQLVLDDEKIRLEKKVDITKIHRVVDDYLVDNLGLRKAADGFYYGDGTGRDFSRFGLAFNTL